MTRTLPFQLVAIDDSEEDLFLLDRLLQRSGMSPRLLALHGGAQGVAWLSAQIDRGTDDLLKAILLDLHMPGTPGLEVLRWIRRQRAFADTAVIMLSSSEDPAPVQRAYALGAQCFLLKHPAPDEFAQVLRDALRFALEPGSRSLLFQGGYNRILETAVEERTFGFTRIED